jgi:DnaA family protein
VTEQLVFDLAAPEPPSFDNFLPAGNAEALAALKALGAGRGSETGIMLWGAPGAGKTHLLRAAVAMVEARGRPSVFIPDPNGASVDESDLPLRYDLVAIDAIDRRDARGASAPLYVVQRPQGSWQVISSWQPARRWPRSRCGKTFALDSAGGSSTK